MNTKIIFRLWGQAWLDTRNNYCPEEVLQADVCCFLLRFLFLKDCKLVWNWMSVLYAETKIAHKREESHRHITTPGCEQSFLLGYKQISPAQIVCTPDAAWIPSTFWEMNCYTLTSCAKISKLKTAWIKPSAIASTFPLSRPTVSRHLGPPEDIHLFIFNPCLLCIQGHKGFLGSVPAAMGWRQFNILDTSPTQQPSTLTYTFSLELPVNNMPTSLNSERNPKYLKTSGETQREHDDSPFSQSYSHDDRCIYYHCMEVVAWKLMKKSPLPLLSQQGRLLSQSEVLWEGHHLSSSSPLYAVFSIIVDVSRTSWLWHK